MGRGPLLRQVKSRKTSPFPFNFDIKGLCGFSPGFPGLSPSIGQVTHVLLTRSPLYSGSRRCPFSFDLHVLGTPPALILSQDQTLKFFSLTQII